MTDPTSLIAELRRIGEEFLDGMEGPMMTMYALFKNGKQISKAHANESVVWVEAVERGVVFTSTPDFSSDRRTRTLVEGYKIRPVESQAVVRGATITRD